MAGVAIGATAGVARAALTVDKNDVEVFASSAAFVNCKGDRTMVSVGWAGEYNPGIDEPKVFPFLARLNGPGGGVAGSANYVFPANLDNPGLHTTFGYCSATLPALKKRSKKVGVAAGEVGTATAKCPRGNKAFSGGFDTPDPANPGQSAGMYPFISKRVGKRKWKVSVVSDVTGELKASAFCAANGPGLDVASKTTTITDSNTGSVAAKCGRGLKAISGGFASSLDLTVPPRPEYAHPFTSKRGTQRKWKVAAFGEGGDPSQLKAFAYCVNAGAL